MLGICNRSCDCSFSPCRIWSPRSFWSRCWISHKIRRTQLHRYTIFVVCTNLKLKRCGFLRKILLAATSTKRIPKISLRRQVANLYISNKLVPNLMYRCFSYLDINLFGKNNQSVQLQIRVEPKTQILSPKSSYHCSTTKLPPSRIKFSFLSAWASESSSCCKNQRLQKHRYTCGKRNNDPFKILQENPCLYKSWKKFNMRSHASTHPRLCLGCILLGIHFLEKIYKIYKSTVKKFVRISTKTWPWCDWQIYNPRA